MLHMLSIFASESAEADSPLAALGVDGKTLLFQLITFALAFLILKRFAFKPITKMLRQRRQVINDGIKLGEEMEKEKATLDEKATQIIREARLEADKIIAIAQKEAREVIAAAEKGAKAKVDQILKDADMIIAEDAERARRAVEKDIVALVSEATEAVVNEKVDARKDAEVLDKALKGRKK